MAKTKTVTIPATTIDTLIEKHAALEADIQKVYQQNGLTDNETVYRTNIERFFKHTAKSKAEVERTISQVVRVVNPKGEWLFFDETLTSTDYIGSFITCTRRIGTAVRPIVRINYAIDPETGEKLVRDIGILEQRPEYCIPFTKENVEILRPFMIHNVSLILKTEGQRKYGGFNLQDFTNLSAQEILDLGMYGTVRHREMLIEAKKVKEAKEKGLV